MLKISISKFHWRRWSQAQSPWSCVSCRIPSFQLKALCPTCVKLLLERQLARNRGAGENAVWNYDPLLERTIRQLRQQESLILLQQIALLVQHWLAQEANSISAVVASPAKPRGVNISTLPARLCHVLAEALGPHCQALDPFTKTQAWQQHGRKRKSRTSAPLLLQKANEPLIERCHPGGKILLLDDLIVTGTTLGQTTTWLQDRGYVVRPLALARKAPQNAPQRLQNKPIPEQPNLRVRISY